MGWLIRASGTHNLHKTVPRPRSVLSAACLPVSWDLCSGEGLVSVVGRRLRFSVIFITCVWLLFQLRNFFFLF